MPENRLEDEFRRRYQQVLVDRRIAKADIARRIGVPQQTVSLWFRSEHPQRLRIDDAQLLADAVGLPLTSFLGPPSTVVATAAAQGGGTATAVQKREAHAQLREAEKALREAEGSLDQLDLALREFERARDDQRARVAEQRLAVDTLRAATRTLIGGN